MFCNKTRIFLFFFLIFVPEQASWVHKALHTAMNFAHCVLHAQKSLQIVPSEAGPTFLYVCKALSALAVLARRAGNYRMKEGFMPWHSLSLSCSACTHRGHSSGSVPTGCHALHRMEAASRPVLPSSSRVGRLSCAPMHWAALVEMMTGTTVKN